MNRAIVGRGAAYGDYDNDGDLDLLITTNNGPARLLRNDNANQNDLLRVRTVGARANRDGIGAKVVVKTSKGRTLYRDGADGIELLLAVGVAVDVWIG